VELQSTQGLEIHWFSIMNSVVTAVLLTGFLATILIRVLKNDFTRYARADLEDQDEEEESGWKLVHGDVFRPPANPLLFASLVGSGVQLLCLVIGLLILAGLRSPPPDSQSDALLLLVCLMF
jgi:transmembrane 9 superfamily protein 1